MADLADLTARMRAFTEARDWGRFHDPKSLTLALTGEVGELAELVQWLPASDAVNVPDERLRERLGEELADVLLYLVRLADVAGIDLGAEAAKKLMRNESRFPAVAHRGVAQNGTDRCRSMELPPIGGSEPRPNRLPPRTRLHPGDHG